MKLKQKLNASLLKVDKKARFTIYSALVSLFVLLFAFGGSFEYRVLYTFLALACSILGVFIIQFPSVSFRNFSTHSLMPFHLTVGVLGSFYYFPNLSIYIKITLVILFFIALYIASLINNIFLVIEERSESIPLYRAALTWMQILLISLTIPFFASVFKINVNAIVQNFIASLSSASLVMYLIWSYSFEDSHKNLSRGEKSSLVIFTMFFVFFSGLAVSFIPTESFLRSIFVASVFMFCLNYVSETLKNNVTMNLIVQHLVITATFLAILLVFNP